MLQICNETPVSFRPIGRHLFAQTPTLRAEGDSPEEYEIKDFEVKIRKRKNQNISVKELEENLKNTYRSWIDRLDREISETTDPDESDKKVRERSRAVQNYGYIEHIKH